MAKLKVLMLAGGALIALGHAAVAADLLPPAPALEPLPSPAAEFSGWYLRGDVGIGANASSPNLKQSPDLVTDELGTDFDAAGTNKFYNSKVSDFGIFDIGLGYQFNNWFRADVTEEYRGGAPFQALEVINEPNAVGTHLGPQQYDDSYRANLWSAITMFNGYVDMGTWWGITPYVGAGVGFSYNRLSGFSDTSANYPGNTTGGTGYPGGGYADDHGKWNFAWDLTGGLSFNVTPNLKLDLSYRYLDYGKFSTGTLHCLAVGATTGFDIANCGGGYAISSKNDLASNDFRIGLRWMIGEEPSYAPAPLVRKY
jgi:opacity protein-like surface antigen